MRLSNDIERITRINVEIAYADLSSEHRETLIQRSIASTLANALEMPLIWQRDNQWLHSQILAINGQECLQEALDEGKGVIIMAPHTGNWECIGRVLPAYAPITCLYQPPKYPELETLVKTGRQKAGAIVVPTTQRGIASLLKALRRGEMVGILPDQVPRAGSGQFAPFFGRPAYTMTLVHSLAQKTGCKILLGYALRSEKNNRHGFTAYFSEASEDCYDADIHSALTAMNTMVEQAVNHSPEQYQWAYKRYKIQPDNLTNPYRRYRNRSSA